jgi:integrase
MLLTGARPGEILALLWTNVDMKWRRLTLRETVENLEGREIPLTPYVRMLLDRLPRESEWVFASRKGSPISSPNHQLTAAATEAGIPKLTLHGLRRSFKSLSEYVEVPAGVTAQIMGHKPSAIAEKHYTVRSIDLLRTHHERIEAWILKEAGIELNKSDAIPRENAAEEKNNQITEAHADSTTV